MVLPREARSAKETLILAAAKFSRPFSGEEIAIEAWKLSPRNFGLRGYNDIHPDNNRVKALLCGVKGIVAAGTLIKTAPSTYQLSEAGHKLAARILAGEKITGRAGRSKPVKAVLFKAEQWEADRLLSNFHFQKWMAGSALPSALPSAWGSALSFWDCETLDEVIGAAPIIEALLQKLLKSLPASGEIEFDSGKTTTKKEIQKCIAFHIALCAQWKNKFRNFFPNR